MKVIKMSADIQNNQISVEITSDRNSCIFFSYFSPMHFTVQYTKRLRTLNLYICFTPLNYIYINKTFVDLHFAANRTATMQIGVAQIVCVWCI